MRHSGFGVEGLLWVSGNVALLDILARNASLPVIGPCLEEFSGRKIKIIKSNSARVQ